jgi:predicted Rossmann fold flavoprotein
MISIPNRSKSFISDILISNIAGSVFEVVMNRYSTIIIGGGAAGICAAISSARRGESVIVCEKMPQLGKKILATGNGRCNLLNEDMSEVNYNSAARDLVKSVFAKFGKSAMLSFFQGLGLETYSREGRIFPVTNQAASVLKVLEMEVARLAIPREFCFDCSGVVFSGNRLQVTSKTGKTFEARKVIITSGGKSYPVTGSDGSMYEIAAQLGHSLIEPVPSVVPLVVIDPLCQFLQGQRIFAAARSIIEGRKGNEVSGELLFTKYGLSGTCILDISEDISIALNRYHQNEVFVTLDMAPFMSKERLRSELEKRRAAGQSAEDILVGILPNKVGLGFKDIFKKNNLGAAINSIKDRRFRISGTRGWNEAEFTNGGIDVNEVNSKTLESKIAKGVYFAGEILDVNGKRGGYNLGWAWASGFVAGESG